MGTEPVFGRREPERTCIGCRERAPKPELIRMVRRPDGRVAIDLTGKAPGRGAYAHPNEVCLQKARKSGALGRSLRTSLGPAEAASLIGELSQAIEKREGIIE